MTAFCDLDGDEIVVRALIDPFWDPIAQRGTPSAFLGQDISVSRVRVRPYKWITERFIADFGERVHATGQAQVIRIIDQAEQVLEQTKRLPLFRLRVVEDPLPDNPAHALIRGIDREDPAKRRAIKARSIGLRLLKVFGTYAL